jgi:endonuclease/exonuclease/phosphatase family metal-dependent hydrolase
MKLISLNIGIKLDNSKEVGNFVKEQNPDIVAFQEIVRHFDESVFDMYKSQKDIKEIIGKELPYSFFGPQWIADAVRENGKMYRNFNGFIEQGNEIVSKFPILNATNEFYHKHYSFGYAREIFYTDDHPRCVQVVELDARGKGLQILNLHGLHSKDKWDSQGTINQCKYILKAAKRKDIPTIIVGDFNLFPETKSIKILNKGFKNLINEYEIKSTRPNFDDGTDRGNNVVDYVFVNDKIHVNSFAVINTNISDHLPLILDFDILG